MGCSSYIFTINTPSVWAFAFGLVLALFFVLCVKLGLVEL